ncbi:dnaJ homolog subfamily C member 17 [Lethenteron reissneri]|uniref:dnaJ homolog subfamily C member 17 n=1 Tax=Lethenteron reissneri TaxID=7753 RepID=UPI002AB7DAAB|nr:dnaJ homolog subfamily C member 17 [Lethenteron reissneri]
MAAKDCKDVLQMDLYGLLGIKENASPKEIKKAYRRKALECHPDKNPDNPSAVELFHELSRALEVLTDAAARAAYDKVQRAKRLAAERTKNLDEKRKKVKLDLESKESNAWSSREEQEAAAKRLQEEIERLREEGSRQLEEEQKLIREQIRRQKEQRGHGNSTSTHQVTPKLKVKWKSKKDDESNGGYSEQQLMVIFQKYGEVMNLLISAKKKGSAIVEFASPKSADLAARNELGLAQNPISVSWLEGRPPGFSSSSRPPCGPTSSTAPPVERDFESVVMMRMRQAAERQRLIDEIRREEEEAGEL